MDSGTDDNTSTNGVAALPLAPGLSDGRPASNGRVKNLRRRFTTPAEIISSSGAALDLATQVYSPHSDRKPSDGNGHDITVGDGDSLDDIEVFLV